MNHIQVFQRPLTRIAGLGIHLPEKIVDNETLAEQVNAPERLRKRLPGIIDRTTRVRSRRHAGPGEYPSDLAAVAAKRAMEHAGIAHSDVDTLIYASTDMDQLEPATANILQQKLGWPVINSFDVSNACNSFLQAVNVGNSLIATGGAQCVVVCAAELGSHWINYDIRRKQDLRTKMGGLTLGDAAASVVLTPADDDGAGIQEINLVTLGEHWRLCHVPENIDWRAASPRSIHGWFYLDMSALARIVKDLSVNYFQEYRQHRRELFGEEDFVDGLKKVVPHQISRRLIEEVVSNLHADMDMVAITADEFGNTAAAAIPLTLHMLIESGETRWGTGDEILLFGAASGLGMGHIRIRL
ncbi:3-oxoacyl-ACP synthase III family protein [Kiritimatiella glycovorans]|uniref:3-oxoacyl-[acyl-carrier-protein] synthase 3 n=1 Tax=Kiritimatiella glycovorans TaxID=1307763 RepID=A0A0G3EF77_9BACT|nr:ketoacyl-ACP synthase III [Kiritimatiella glycovorans]AKJ65111.1 3-oxoacyl-[acyl-carrier-protein] synthase 3 [Kiritimatiella glycovorans]